MAGTGALTRQALLRSGAPRGDIAKHATTSAIQGQSLDQTGERLHPIARTQSRPVQQECP
jgi:hypothetical protein